MNFQRGPKFPDQLPAAPRAPSFQQPKPAQPVAPQPQGLPMPEVNPEYERLARQVKSAGVTVRQIEQYAKAKPNEPLHRVAMAAAADRVWADVAKKYGTLGNDPLENGLKWQQHWAFSQGKPGATDPLLSQYPGAVKDIEERLMQIVQEQAAAMNRRGGPRLNV